MTVQHDRSYIRHLTSVPLEVKPYSMRQKLTLQLNNVSVGGLSFNSPTEFHPGDLVKIKIKETKPVFYVDGVVQWCHQCEGFYELGVEFLGEEDAFRVRMMEQVCHIEHYRQSQMKDGRHISKNDASREWIEKHGSEFPH